MLRQTGLGKGGQPEVAGPEVGTRICCFSSGPSEALHRLPPTDFSGCDCTKLHEEVKKFWAHGGATEAPFSPSSLNVKQVNKGQTPTDTDGHCRAGFHGGPCVTMAKSEHLQGQNDRASKAKQKGRVKPFASSEMTLG